MKYPNVVCEHGGLRRKCDVCDLEAEVARLRQVVLMAALVVQSRGLGDLAQELRREAA